MRLIFLLTALTLTAACETGESALPGQVCEVVPEFSESCEYVECVNQDHFSSHVLEDGSQIFTCTWFSAEWEGEISQVTLQWDVNYLGCWTLTERVGEPLCYEG